MSHLIPLYYSNQLVHHAQVDSELGILSDLPWGLRLPDYCLRDNDYRTDIIAARLAEDDDLIHKCHPRTQLVIGDHSYTLNLAKVALRRELIEPLVSFRLVPTFELFDELRSVAVLVQRIVFLNRSRVDCRTSNLREIVSLSE